MKKQPIGAILLMTLLASSCLDTVSHNHGHHAFTAQAYIIEAIYLEDSLQYAENRNKYISLFSEAIEESTLAKRSELNGLYENWGDMFHDYLIEGAIQTIDGYLESDPQISLDKLSNATALITKYSDWFNENVYRMDEQLNIQKE